MSQYYLLIFCLLLSHEAMATSLLFMEKGDVLKIPSPEFEKVWVSKSQIISVQDRGSYLKIQARREGQVLLNIGARRYSIYVLQVGQKSKLQAVNDFLSQRKGLKININEGRLSIQGQLYRIKDFIDLSKQAQALSLNYIFEAEVQTSLRPALEKYIYDSVKSAPPFQISWQKPLVAFVPKKQADLYKEQLKHLGVVIKEDPSLLPNLKPIKLKILLVESSNNQAFQKHIDWGRGLIQELLEGRIFQQILSSFKTMETKGHSHILSEAVLMGESGESTYFHSGGEVPIPYFNPETGTQTIKWKPYGIRIKCLATADRKEKIHIKTEVEISEVDHSQSARGAPALKSNRILSSTTMKSGQTLLLSKLIREQHGKSLAGPVEMTRIPIIGSLLSLKGKVGANTRLHIFITGKIKTRK